MDLLDSFDQHNGGFSVEQLSFSQLGYCHPSKRVENIENYFKDEVFESLTTGSCFLSIIQNQVCAALTMNSVSSLEACMSFIVNDVC